MFLKRRALCQCASIFPGCQNIKGKHNEKQHKDETQTKQYEKKGSSSTETPEEYSLELW